MVFSNLSSRTSTGCDPCASLERCGPRGSSGLPDGIDSTQSIVVIMYVVVSSAPLLLGTSREGLIYDLSVTQFKCLSKQKKRVGKSGKRQREVQRLFCTKLCLCHGDVLFIFENVTQLGLKLCAQMTATHIVSSFK